MSRTHNHRRPAYEGGEPKSWHSRWSSPRSVSANRRRDQTKTRSLWKVALEQLPTEAWEDGVVLRFGRSHFIGHIH
jgi:hypothetical protein